MRSHCRVPWSIKSRVILQLKLGVTVGSTAQFKEKVAARIPPTGALGPAARITPGTVPGTVPTVVPGMSIWVSLTETNAISFGHLSQLKLV
jgi:hypothetical protein